MLCQNMIQAKVKPPLKSSTVTAPRNFTLHHLTAYSPEEHPLFPLLPNQTLSAWTATLQIPSLFKKWQFTNLLHIYWIIIINLFFLASTNLSSSVETHAIEEWLQKTFTKELWVEDFR